MTEIVRGTGGVTDKLWIEICKVVGTNFETYGTLDSPAFDELRQCAGKAATQEVVAMEVTAA